MKSSLSTIEISATAASVAIPPCPKVVMDLMAEQGMIEPNLRKVAKLIAGDVGICAAVIKTINSPLYGLRSQISTIEHAVALLGLRNVVTLVTGLALKNSVPACGLDRFWDESARKALLTAALSQMIRRSTREAAHMFGLFQNCGIPLMLKRFPEYKETLKIANQDTTRPFIEVENERHITNHASMGKMLADIWRLPEPIKQGIHLHHDPYVFRSNALPEAKDLVALLHLAETVENEHFRKTTHCEWETLGRGALAHLGIEDGEWAAIKQDVSDLLLMVEID